MNNLSFERRELLKLSGAGVIGTSALAQTSAAKKSDIFREDFEEWSTGTVPDGFVLAGNSDQQVVDDYSSTGSHSYRMSGSHGGCWRAIMRRELFSDTERPDSMLISGAFRRGDGAEGCHDNQSGRIGWRTVASSSWSAGSGTALLQFRPDGDITVAGETVGTYEPEEWVSFEVEYHWDRDAGEVEHVCRIEDSQPVTAVRDERDDEGEMTALALRSDDYTVFFDDLSVRSVDPDPAPQTGTVTGNVVDTDLEPLTDAIVEIVPIDNDTPEATVKTDADGEFEVEVPVDEYELTATADGFETTTETVTVAADTSTSVSLFLSEPLAARRSEKLDIADRVEAISVRDIDEESAVGTLFDEYESLLDADEVDTEQAKEAVDRLIMAEELITRAMEITSSADPKDSETPDYNISASSYEALLFGVIEWKFGIVEIKKKLSELTGYEEIISSALEYLKDGIEDLIVEQVGETAPDTIGSVDKESLERAEEVSDRIDTAQDIASGDIRALVEELVSPAATALGQSMQLGLEGSDEVRVGTESAPGYESQIEMTVEQTKPDVWDEEHSFQSDFVDAQAERSMQQNTMDSRADSVIETLEPEHDGLLDFITRVLDLLQAEGIWGIIDALKELAQFIWDRFPIVSSGFNAGQGFAATRRVVIDSHHGVETIVGREQS